MKNQVIKRVLSFLLVFTAVFVKAQGNEGPQMADAFRENGKIYVVIAVIAIVFIALVLFLVSIERNVKKLEDKLNKEN